ncbi:molecular chaperone Hsp33 [Pelagibius litoralis]|uniref:Molecular chaperone Hsp33 n=2 Tax=Pelagibius litoralis TaxID=374515 RepID=A0A967KHR4_9PROT|nr:molecular chaperone Hsp33 [Pelagibius litoralis]
MPEGDRTGRRLEADQVQPFLLESSDIRGRLLRLERVSSEILRRHDYPDPVAQLLAEMLALCGGLSAMLKYEGIFTLQASGDGPIRVMVVDVTSEGAMRGYAGFDRERLAQAVTDAGGDRPTVPALFGKGSLAFTVDQGDYSDRYQGIVALDGDTLADCLQHYFMQSEQLQSGIVLAAGRRGDGWVSAALVLQRLPEESVGEIDDEDDWRRAMVLQASCRPDELLDDGLPLNDLLYRLFHEEGVRVFEPRPLVEACRCSGERLEAVLGAMPRPEIEELKIDGAVEVTCEFCTRVYRFDEDDLERIYAP